MQDHVYKTLELTGTSTTNTEDALRNALRRANKTVKHMRWFQVTDVRGNIEEGEVSHWQVTVKVGFTLE
jgi:flavin-binding protein dodecin